MPDGATPRRPRAPPLKPHVIDSLRSRIKAASYAGHLGREVEAIFNRVDKDSPHRPWEKGARARLCVCVCVLSVFCLCLFVWTSINIPVFTCSLRNFAAHASIVQQSRSGPRMRSGSSAGLRPKLLQIAAKPTIVGRTPLPPPRCQRAPAAPRAMALFQGAADLRDDHRCVEPSRIIEGLSGQVQAPAGAGSCGSESVSRLERTTRDAREHRDRGRIHRRTPRVQLTRRHERSTGKPHQHEGLQTLAP